MFDTTNAKCREIDPEIFFPEGNQPDEEIKVIKSLCGQCEVFLKCRAYSLQYDVDGWWAGLNKPQRKALQKEQGIVPEPILHSTGYWLIEWDSIQQRNRREKKRKII